jgi:hypothetical protein
VESELAGIVEHRTPPEGFRDSEPWYAAEPDHFCEDYGCHGTERLCNDIVFLLALVSRGAEPGEDGYVVPSRETRTVQVTPSVVEHHTVRFAEQTEDTLAEALREARAFVAGVDLHGGAAAEPGDQWRHALLPKIDAALAEEAR